MTLIETLQSDSSRPRLTIQKKALPARLLNVWQNDMVRVPPPGEISPLGWHHPNPDQRNNKASETEQDDRNAPQGLVGTAIY